MQNFVEHENITAFKARLKAETDPLTTAIPAGEIE